MKRIVPVLFLILALTVHVACESGGEESSTAKTAESGKAVLPKAKVSNKLAKLKNAKTSKTKSAAPTKAMSTKEIAAKFPDGKYPVLSVKDQEFDFGTVQQGEDAKHVFVLRNNGKAMLNIEKAKGS